jgi:hypothetical protein
MIPLLDASSMPLIAGQKKERKVDCEYSISIVLAYLE